MLFLLVPMALMPVPTIATVEQAMPAWWNNWLRLSSFSSPFTQEGESAAFGKLTSKGTILIAKGGRLRVEYDKGMILLCNGALLVQYDPSTRTAQRHHLESVSEEWPLLRLLTDPTALNEVFHVALQAGGEITLTPKNPGLPKVNLEGKGSFLHSATWIYGTGAKQVLTLTAPKTPPDPGNGPFSFELPTGAKWINADRD